MALLFFKTINYKNLHFGKIMSAGTWKRECSGVSVKGVGVILCFWPLYNFPATIANSSVSGSNGEPATSE